MSINLYPERFESEATTVWSFPERGKWATHSPKYRGNWAPQIPRNVILKYTKEDSDITISLTQNMDTWTFSICNPVQKDVDVKKIFQKYYRNNEEVFGLGLGLELVESICKENNININAICNNGQFCINMELMQTI